MRRLLPACLIVGLTSGLMPANTRAAEKPMQPVLSQLDLNGKFMLFMDTAALEARVLKYIDLFSELAKQDDPLSSEKIDAMAALFKQGLNESGFLSIDTFAMSVQPVDSDLSRIIAIADYGEEDAGKYLWRIIASEPKKLSGLAYAPADTVYLANSTASINEGWKVFNEVVETYLPPEQQSQVQEGILLSEAMLGVTVDELLGSIDHEILVSIQLSETNVSLIPSPLSALTIPEPSIIIGVQTKNPMLGQLVLAKLQESGAPVVQTQHGGQTLNTMNLPVPSPIPFAPTLVQTEDYLLLGTNPKAIAAALDSRANGTGLVATPLYRKLLADAPEKVSAIKFLSPRLLNTYMETVEAFMESAAESGMPPASWTMLGTTMLNFKDIQSGAYLLKKSDGLYLHGYSNKSNPGEIIASSGMSYIGLIGMVGLRSFQSARGNALEKVCQNNRRILASAKEQWAMGNEAAEGSPVTEADVSPYINGGFSALQCPDGGTYTINPVGTASECSLHRTAEFY